MREKQTQSKKTNFLKILRPRNLLIVFFSLAVLTSLVNLFIARLYFRSYNLLGARELIAVVDCVKENGKVLKVDFYPDTDKEKKQSFSFDADEWVIEGRIVKWKPLLGLFGVNNYYKLERISGRYIDIEKERKMSRQVYALCPEPDRIWLFLYKYQKLLPFIDAVYGNSAFVRFKPGAKYQVYITSTGFMIKDVTVKIKKSWWFTG